MPRSLVARGKGEIKPISLNRSAGGQLFSVSGACTQEPEKPGDLEGGAGVLAGAVGGRLGVVLQL